MLQALPVCGTSLPEPWEDTVQITYSFCTGVQSNTNDAVFATVW